MSHHDEDYVKSVDNLKKIVLKRGFLVRLSDEYFNYFRSLVIGCFVRVTFKKSYKLAEIVDAMEVEG